VAGLDGLLDELHAGMFYGLAAFFDVAGRAGTNDVFPGCFAAQAARDYVVERQFAGREVLAAILAMVFVAGEDVPAVELDLVSRQTVVEEQPNDSRHGNMKIHGRYPIVPIRLEITPELTYLAPALEIVVGISTLFE